MAVTVVGCGVTGLSVAVRLLEAGFDVGVVAAQPPEATTSIVAGAVWTTTEVEPVARSLPWALASRAVFEQLASDPEAGVAPLQIVELHRTDPGPSDWLDTRWVTRLRGPEVPPGYGSAWLIEGFAIRTDRYLRYLEQRLRRLGGSLVVAPAGLERLEDAPGAVVVNCSGLGAARLCGDPGVHPIRGQIVLVSNPGVTRALSDECDPDRITYLYPHSDHLFLGGTREPGVWDLEPDPAQSERILADARLLEPRLHQAEVLGVRVGLRPGRSEVRLEAGALADGRPVVHDYGHAGCGFTLSWGCADEVVALVRSL